MAAASAPRARNPAPAPGSPSPCRSPTTPADGDRARVLVVDDDPRTLRFAREAIDGAGFDTMATGNFRDLARIVDAERPARVLLDLVLARQRRHRAKLIMAQAQALAELPVIFISAYDRAEALARAFDAGADDYLVKPFSATELTARVRAARRAAPVRARRAGHRLPRSPRHARRPQADGNAAAARRRGWRTGVPGFALPRQLAGVERGRDACSGRLFRAGRRAAVT